MPASSADRYLVQSTSTVDVHEPKSKDCCNHQPKGVHSSMTFDATIYSVIQHHPFAFANAASATHSLRHIRMGEGKNPAVAFTTAASVVLRPDGDGGRIR